MKDKKTKEGAAGQQRKQLPRKMPAAGVGVFIQVSFGSFIVPQKVTGDVVDVKAEEEQTRALPDSQHAPEKPEEKP